MKTFLLGLVLVFGFVSVAFATDYGNQRIVERIVEVPNVRVERVVVNDHCNQNQKVVERVVVDPHQQQRQNVKVVERVVVAQDNHHNNVQKQVQKQKIVNQPRVQKDVDVQVRRLGRNVRVQKQVNR